MEKNNWPRISNKLRRIHPVMRKKVITFEKTLNRATVAAKQSDPKGVSLALEACKLSIALCSDIEHLTAVGILSKDGLKKGIEDYTAGRFHYIFLKYSAVLTKEDVGKMMTGLVEDASELEHKWLYRLVRFAQEVKDMEFGRQSSE